MFYFNDSADLVVLADLHIKHFPQGEKVFGGKHFFNYGLQPLC